MSVTVTVEVVSWKTTETRTVLLTGTAADTVIAKVPEAVPESAFTPMLVGVPIASVNVSTGDESAVAPVAFT